MSEARTVPCTSVSALQHCWLDYEWLTGNANKCLWPLRFIHVMKNRFIHENILIKWLCWVHKLVWCFWVLSFAMHILTFQLLTCTLCVILTPKIFWNNTNDQVCWIFVGAEVKWTCPQLVLNLALPSNLLKINWLHSFFILNWWHFDLCRQFLFPHHGNERKAIWFSTTTVGTCCWAV